MPRKKKKSETESPTEDVVESVEKTMEKITKQVEKVVKGKTSKDKKEATNKTAKKKIKKEEKSEKKVEEKTLIPLENYVKAGCYIGTKVITPHMRKYVYRRRNDGIAIINTNIIDKKLKQAAEFLSKFEPEDFIVVCKREAGWKAVNLFAKLTGARVFTKKYPAGILTNTQLPDFFETELVVICDPWLDKNALRDVNNVKKQVLGLCDTNNLTNGVDVIVPINNKSNKSLGVAFYVLAKVYLKARGREKELPDIEEFIGEKLQELQVKKPGKKRDIELEKARKKIEKLRELNKEE